MRAIDVLTSAAAVFVAAVRSMENLKGSVDKVASSVDKVAGKVVSRDGDDAQAYVVPRIAMHSRRASAADAPLLLLATFANAYSAAPKRLVTMASASDLLLKSVVRQCHHAINSCSVTPCSAMLFR